MNDDQSQDVPALSFGSHPAASVPINIERYAVPPAGIPVDDKMPVELVVQLDLIRDWALANRDEAKWEAVWFWALKIPVIVASAGYGALMKFGWEEALAVCGAFASACVLIDGFYRPGVLRNFHHKAYFELSALIDDITSQWQIAVLGGEKDCNALAAKLITEARAHKVKIANYLADAEATLGKERKRDGK